MGYDFVFPDVAEGIREGKLIEWKVKEGDVIKADQALCDIETDKSVVELPSPRKGRITRLHFKSGDTVKVGDALVTFEEEGDAQTEAPKEILQKREAPAAEKTTSPHNEARILPKERMLAKKLGVDITRITGTGPGGRITRQDIEGNKGIRIEAKQETQKATAATPAARIRLPPSMRKQARELGIKPEQLLGTAHEQAQPLAIEGERIKIEGVRATIKRHLETAWRTIPHAAVTIEFNAGKLIAHRKKARAQLEEKGIKLTYLAYIVRVAADALENFPRFNALIDDATQEFILKSRVDIGIAVDTDYGLVVPVVKDCNRKSIAEIAKEIQELAQKARDKKLSPDNIEAGVFSITNVGSFGAKGGAAVINHPAVAILMTGVIDERVALAKGKVTKQSIMPLTLTFDHRIVDGADAGRFLEFMIELLSDPKMNVEVM